MDWHSHAALILYLRAPDLGLVQQVNTWRHRACVETRVTLTRNQGCELPGRIVFTLFNSLLWFNRCQTVDRLHLQDLEEYSLPHSDVHPRLQGEWEPPDEKHERWQCLPVHR